MTFMNKKKETYHGSIKRVHSSASQMSSKFARLSSNLDNKINLHDYFFHQRPFANVKISLNQQIIWCDKASLASASPILREQLLRNTKDDEPLVFNDIDVKDFLSMLEFIYPIFHPEINEQNISCLIELSHRFQFDMLKHACQIYVLKYLNTIRRVFDNCQNSEAEGDCFGINNHRENERHRQRDLIEFHDRICLDAFDIITKLYRWLKTYYDNNNLLVTQAIISVLRQMSVDYLEQAMISIPINDELKVYIYKERAQYLERTHHMKPIA